LTLGHAENSLALGRPPTTDASGPAASRETRHRNDQGPPFPGSSDRVLPAHAYVQLGIAAEVRATDWPLLSGRPDRPLPMHPGAELGKRHDERPQRGRPSRPAPSGRFRRRAIRRDHRRNRPVVIPGTQHHSPGTRHSRICSLASSCSCTNPTETSTATIPSDRRTSSTSGSRSTPSLTAWPLIPLTDVCSGHGSWAGR
jgi:hypothetical protein